MSFIPRSQFICFYISCTLMCIISAFMPTFHFMQIQQFILQKCPLSLQNDLQNNHSTYPVFLSAHEHV